MAYDIPNIQAKINMPKEDNDLRTLMQLAMMQMRMARAGSSGSGGSGGGGGKGDYYLMRDPDNPGQWKTVFVPGGHTDAIKRNRDIMQNLNDQSVLATIRKDFPDVAAELAALPQKSVGAQKETLDRFRQDLLPKLQERYGFSTTEATDVSKSLLAEPSALHQREATALKEASKADAVFSMMSQKAGHFLESLFDPRPTAERALSRAERQRKEIEALQESNAYLRDQAKREVEGEGFFSRGGGDTGSYLANLGIAASDALPGLATTMGGALAGAKLGALAAGPGGALAGTILGAAFPSAVDVSRQAISQVEAMPDVSTEQKQQIIEDAHDRNLAIGAAASVLPTGLLRTAGIAGRAALGSMGVGALGRSANRAGEAAAREVLTRRGTQLEAENARRVFFNNTVNQYVNDAIAQSAGRSFVSGYFRNLPATAAEAGLYSGLTTLGTNLSLQNAGAPLSAGEGVMESVGAGIASAPFLGLFNARMRPMLRQREIEQYTMPTPPLPHTPPADILALPPGGGGSGGGIALRADTQPATTPPPPTPHTDAGPPIFARSWNHPGERLDALPEGVNYGYRDPYVDVPVVTPYDPTAQQQALGYSARALPEYSNTQGVNERGVIRMGRTPDQPVTEIDSRRQAKIESLEAARKKGVEAKRQAAAEKEVADLAAAPPRTQALYDAVAPWYDRKHVPAEPEERLKYLQDREAALREIVTSYQAAGGTLDEFVEAVTQTSFTARQRANYKKPLLVSGKLTGGARRDLRAVGDAILNVKRPPEPAVIDVTPVREEIPQNLADRAAEAANVKLTPEGELDAVSKAIANEPGAASGEPVTGAAPRLGEPGQGEAPGTAAPTPAGDSGVASAAPGVVTPPPAVGLETAAGSNRDVKVRRVGGRRAADTGEGEAASGADTGARAVRPDGEGEGRPDGREAADRGATAGESTRGAGDAADARARGADERGAASPAEQSAGVVPAKLTRAAAKQAALAARKKKGTTPVVAEVTPAEPWPVKARMAKADRDAAMQSVWKDISGMEAAEAKQHIQSRYGLTEKMAAKKYDQVAKWADKNKPQLEAAAAARAAQEEPMVTLRNDMVRHFGAENMDSILPRQQIKFIQEQYGVPESVAQQRFLELDDYLRNARLAAERELTTAAEQAALHTDTENFFGTSIDWDAVNKAAAEQKKIIAKNTAEGWAQRICGK